MTEYSIWPSTDGPFSDNADAPVSLGMQFSASAQAWVTALRYWRGTANVNPDDLRLWRVDTGTTGTSMASVTPPAAGTIGWQTVPLATPFELTPGQVYKVATHYPDHYCATGSFWTSGPGAAGITNGILTAQSDAASAGGQCTFAYDPAPLFPDNGTGGNYWSDVVVTDTDPAGATIVDVEQALEDDTAGQITPVRAVQLGPAAELDTAHPVTPVRTLDAGLAHEADSAGAIAPVRVVTVGLALQVDEALPITPVRVVHVGQAAGLETAGAVTPMRVLTLGQAVEADSAAAVALVRLLTVGQAVELDSALPVTPIGPAPAATRGRLTSGTRAGPSITAPLRRLPSIRGE